MTSEICSRRIPFPWNGSHQSCVSWRTSNYRCVKWMIWFGKVLEKDGVDNCVLSEKIIEFFAIYLPKMHRNSNNSMERTHKLQQTQFRQTVRPMDAFHAVNVIWTTAIDAIHASSVRERRHQYNNRTKSLAIILTFLFVLLYWSRRYVENCVRSII